MSYSKSVRLSKLFDELAQLPNAHSGLEAYGQLSVTLNILEDKIWGDDHWQPPRRFEAGKQTDRLYPSTPETFFSVVGFPGVMKMIHTREIVFISRYGAIEIQKEHDRSETLVPFHLRVGQVIFQKVDAYGDQVWHEKNKL